MSLLNKYNQKIINGEREALKRKSLIKTLTDMGCSANDSCEDNLADNEKALIKEAVFLVNIEKWQCCPPAINAQDISVSREFFHFGSCEVLLIQSKTLLHVLFYFEAIYENW